MNSFSFWSIALFLFTIIILYTRTIYTMLATKFSKWKPANKSPRKGQNGTEHTIEPTRIPEKGELWSFQITWRRCYKSQIQTNENSAQWEHDFWWLIWPVVWTLLSYWNVITKKELLETKLCMETTDASILSLLFCPTHTKMTSSHTS